MLASKCDRCGKYYERRPFNYTKVGEYSLSVKKRSQSGTTYETDCDLCDDCQKAIQRFMQSGGKQG